MLVNILLNQLNLPNMIDIVMDNSVQQYEKIVFSVGDFFPQFFGRDGFNGL